MEAMTQCHIHGGVWVAWWVDTNASKKHIAYIFKLKH
jgi:hypothetical protein